MNLRPYQEKAVFMIHSEWQTVNKTLLVLPTGTGKTIVFSAIAADIVADGGKVLILAHRDELIRQAQAKLWASTGLSAAIEKADESAAGCMDSVIVGSVQSLLSPLRRDSIWAPSHIIIDEAHHVLSESYLSVLRHWPNAKVLGVTATPDRGDLQDLGKFFDSLAFEYSITEAIAAGHLCKIKALTCPMKIDLNAVKFGEDFQSGSIASELEPYLPGIARELAHHGRGRKGMVFTPLCATARTLQGYLQAEGVRAYYADGTDRSEIAAYEADGPGAIMVNAMLFVEGYDHPAVDMICVLRLTGVRALYAQMVGRGTRPYPGKDHLLLIDFLWNCEKHSLCRPASLISGDAEIAEAVTRQADGATGTAVDIDLEALEQGKRDVVAQREGKLAKKIAEMRHRKRDLVDPLQYAAAIGAPDLMDYKPTFKHDAEPVTIEQVKKLSDLGIFPEDISSKGHAEHVLSKIAERTESGLAGPRAIKLLERHGFKNVGAYKSKYCQHIINRIRANGWRVPADLKSKLG